MHGYKWSSDELEFLINNYQTKTKLWIAEELGLTEGTVKYQLNNLGLKKRVFFEHDQEFFHTITPVSSYWAGFIAADGCCTKHNQLVIGLQSRDIGHLERFKSDINYTGDVKNRMTYLKGKPFGRAELAIYNASQVTLDLLRNFNITPRKSLTLKPPDIDDFCLSKCFMIGYIDGDGTISCSSGRSKISVLGTKPMMNFFKSRWDKWYPPFSARSLVANIVQKGSIFRYTVTGKRAVTILRDLISVEVPKLRRKWEIFEEHHSNLLSSSGSFLSLYPYLASEWNFERNGNKLPSDFKPHSNLRVWWKCSKGHEWRTTVAKRVGGTGCPYCCKYCSKKWWGSEICKSRPEPSK